MALNNHALRFLKSMDEHSKHIEGVKFIEENPLSSSADIDKKFRWAEAQCTFLSNNYDDKTIKSIRMNCSCGPELGKIKKIKDLYEKDASTFIEKTNKLNLGFVLESDGKSFYLIYPQCYCSCVKRIDKPLPKEWCYCTLGYTKRMFEFILSREVDVELISSVKLGATNCRIKIIVL